MLLNQASPIGGHNAIASHQNQLSGISFPNWPRHSDKHAHLYTSFEAAAEAIGEIRAILEATYSGTFPGNWRDACEHARLKLTDTLYFEGSNELKELLTVARDDIDNFEHLSKHFGSHPLLELLANINSVILVHEQYQETMRRNRSIPDIVNWCAVKSGFGFDAIDSINVTPFNYEVFVNPGRIPSSARSDYGSYSDRTGLIIVVRCDPSIERDTVYHERVHSILCGAKKFLFDTNQGEMRSRFNVLIGRLNSKTHTDKALKTFRRDFSPKYLVNSTHEEILAEFGNVRSKLGRIEALESTANGFELKRFSHTSLLSTAGKFISDLTEHLRSQSSKLLNEAHRNEVIATTEQVTALFNRQIDYLREATFIAEHTNQKLLEDVEALAVFLRPTQWRHLVSYLKNRIPAHKLDKLRILYSLVHAPTISVREFAAIGKFGFHRLTSQDSERLAETCHFQQLVTLNTGDRLFLKTLNTSLLAHSAIVDAFNRVKRLGRQKT